MKRRDGFTLIELLIVVVIIGILAAIAIPKFSQTKGQAYVAGMKADLRKLANAQEDYFASNKVYASDVSTLDMVVSEGTTIDMLEANGIGWSARATNTHVSEECVLVYGATMVAPAVSDGSVACQ